MKQTAAILIATACAGCSTAAGVSQAMLQQGKPIAMWTLPDCAGYVVQSGLVLPVGQRLEALDQICFALTKPVQAASGAK